FRSRGSALRRTLPARRSSSRATSRPGSPARSWWWTAAHWSAGAALRYREGCKEVPMRLYDADAHVVEPPDLFEGRLASRLRERAPRVVQRSAELDVWSFDGGKREVPLNMLLSTPGISPERWTLAGTSYRHVRPGAFDPRARLADMDVDMISAQ